ncbi:hypothetical protein [Gordonia soli]|uniref:Uncharacterized protein n=1 Tax=Gordonia soli NBRC 108243 TaxID=1223545 RepID=M0QFT3_9ACTN|nr:hypothetical protein [Gordonia soli]GAC66262.1 hypothetical protein GS4_01_00640 [Gordonia soli NBRC 108243]
MVTAAAAMIFAGAVCIIAAYATLGLMRGLPRSSRLVGRARRIRALALSGAAGAAAVVALAFDALGTTTWLCAALILVSAALMVYTALTAAP